ncbi:hypothetical protein GWI33_015993 [Rhynchophorus ferrugineus]|uniref:Uncharacterized protein n=1 Tax=Rhynchophorus ferrugineus TaxID=354439 RepID=A0A834I232_RHYFE|nr:hypothetical protein GWI33_015993 [Rhynchophorus ferrugineus]
MVSTRCLLEEKVRLNKWALVLTESDKHMIQPEGPAVASQGAIYFIRNAQKHPETHPKQIRDRWDIRYEERGYINFLAFLVR